MESAKYRTSKEKQPMKTTEVAPITEELLYSDDFALMIVEQNSPQHLTEINVDAHLADLDRMIAEALAADGQATKH